MTGPSKQAINAARAALAKCAANDPWFPHPNEATILAWAEHVARYNLDIGDVLDGVTAAYAANGSGFRPLPKDITDAARAIRNEHTKRWTDDDWGRYEALCDSKAGAKPAQVIALPKPGEDAEADARADVIAARIAEHVEAIAKAKTIPHEHRNGDTA